MIGVLYLSKLLRTRSSMHISATDRNKVTFDKHFLWFGSNFRSHESLYFRPNRMFVMPCLIDSCMKNLYTSRIIHVKWLILVSVMIRDLFGEL